jgi:hypothetical protein
VKNITMEIKEVDLLAYDRDTTERDLSLSLFLEGYLSGTREGLGKKPMSPTLHSDPNWEAGFQTGLECALMAVSKFREVLG